MALSLQQVQKQTQRLIMTPQMQQSIQLLQMNSMELEQLIRQEMLENPFLENADDEEALLTETEPTEEETELIAPEEPDTGVSDQKAEEEKASAAEAEPAPEREDKPTPTDIDPDSTPDPANEAEGSEEFERFEENDVDWNEQFEDSDSITYTSTREETEENDFTTYTGSSDSLYDSLLRQLRLSRLAGKDMEIGEFLIGNLDYDGYLDCSLENQALMVGYPAELIIPNDAGPAETVDKYLRQLLAKRHGGENPDAFTGMKRKELVLRIMAHMLGLNYDQAAAMKREELLRRLIARKTKEEYEELEDLHPSDLMLHSVAYRMKTEPDRVFDVLEILHEFEPTGVAARDLGECLRLQCEELGIRNKLLYRILDEHLSDLQQKRFKEIARALETNEDEVIDVFTTLSRLDPKPGRSVTKDRPQYITPDVYVKKVDGKYMYFLNEGDVGRLKVASNYRRMMANKPTRRRGGHHAARTEVNGVTSGQDKPGDQGDGTDGNAPPAGRWEHFENAAPSDQDAEYASEKYKNAVWLIRNIEKRKSTILRVTEAIMEYQKDFLEKGIEHLHPLTLRDIAERVGMHESTIARVTTKKYVETPRGLFELKYFFSSGLDTDDGEAASSRSIKELLTQMIENEDKRRPLSDQKIADLLRQKGFQIARRTVAKYREQLKILPAKLRKDVR